MPTFESFLTPPGIIVAGGIVTTFIELIKTVFPTLDARVSGALMAFVITAVLYVIVGIVVPQADANGYLVVFCSWLTCAAAAVGIHSAWVHVQTVTGSPTP